MDLNVRSEHDATLHGKELQGLRQSLKKQGRVTNVPKYLNAERYRLGTYAHYPRDAPCSPLLLARQGFVYVGLGQSDDITVICVFCYTVVRNLDSDHNRTDIENLHPACGAVSGKAHENRLVKGGDTNDFHKILSQLRRLDRKHYKRPSLSVGNDGSSSGDSDLPFESSNTLSTSAVGSSGANNTQEEHNSLASTLGDSTAHSPSEQATGQHTQWSDVSVLDTSTSELSPASEDHPTNQLQPHQPSEGNGNIFRNDDSALHVGNHQVQSHAESSELITNRAQSLSLPWHRAAGSDTTNGDNDAGNRNHTSSLSTQNASALIPTTDGASASASSSNSNTGESQRLPSAGDGSSRPQDATSDSSSPVEISSTPTIAQTSSTSSSNSNSEQIQNDNETSSQDGTLSYDKLGIMTARPKRLEFAVLTVRLESFQEWPQGHHIQPLTLAQAGYFFTGYSDCARCFFCGGGLRNWEDGDDVWVEHARWFPKCTFVRQSLGQDFIDVVQDLNKEQEIIPYSDVIREMNIRGLDTKFPQDTKNDKVDLEKDVAVKILIEEGFIKDDVIEAAEHLKKSGQLLSSESVYDELVKRKAMRAVRSARKSKNSASNVVTRKKSKNKKKNQETLESLREANSEFRQQSQCKMCMDKEVAMIFLPCGHFVSCSDCSYALKNCPICRQSIKGVVRGQLG